MFKDYLRHLQEFLKSPALGRADRRKLLAEISRINYEIEKEKKNPG
jgi:hypothetical protein